MTREVLGWAMTAITRVDLEIMWLWYRFAFYLELIVFDF